MRISEQRPVAATSNARSAAAREVHPCPRGVASGRAVGHPRVDVSEGPPLLMSPGAGPALREWTDVESDVSLAALAEAVGLSTSRLMHAFTKSVGIPLRPYVAWLRLQRAAAAIYSGASLTDAASASGFSDASHMSRTFHRMLGMGPSCLKPPAPAGVQRL